MVSNELGYLSIRKKISQLLMPRVDFSEPNALSYARELVKKNHIGGFIVFGGSMEVLRDYTEQLQNLSEFPLFFGCDAERGLGQKLSGSTVFPFAMSLGAIGDEELVYRQASSISREMLYSGLNLIFAPVVDVNRNAENPIINIRSYGDDPNLVSRLGNAFIKGCQDNGVMACAKHFPGHGNTGIDSHISLPNITQSKEDFYNFDLVPFVEAIGSGVAFIMIAHLYAPEICKNGFPSTLSSEVIRDLLINRLGFDGLVISDSFQMGAITEYGKEENLARLAISAGCDIILDPKEPLDLIESLRASVDDGALPRHILDSAFLRVIDIKRKWLHRRIDGLTEDESGAELSEEIARRSVCVIRGGRLRSKKVRILVFDVTEDAKDLSLPFLARFSEYCKDCEVTWVRPSQMGISIPSISSKEMGIVCLVYTSVGAWQRYFKLPDNFRKMLNLIGEMDCEKILVSFGSPYVVNRVKGFDTVICAFDRLDMCQVAVSDVLLGRLEAQGTLPVRLS